MPPAKEDRETTPTANHVQIDLLFFKLIHLPGDICLIEDNGCLRLRAIPVMARSAMIVETILKHTLRMTVPGASSLAQ